MSDNDALPGESAEAMAELGRRVTRIARDRAIGGDELAVAVAIADILATKGPDALSIGNIHRRAFPRGSVPHRDSNGMREYEWKYSTAASVIDRDARKYEPRYSGGVQKCQAPVERRGSPCGQRAGRRTLHTDWATGEKFWIEACSRHLDWYEQRVHQHEESKPQVGEVPRPYANKGGRIARHFPEIDWPGVWRELTSYWTQYPERESSSVPSEWGDLRIRVEEPPQRLHPENVVSFPREPVKEEKSDRYRFQGRLNRTQGELLRLASTGSLKAWRETVYTGSGSAEHWGPHEVPLTQGRFWVRGLVDAGLLRIVPLPRFGSGRHGLYRLTSKGKQWLDSFNEGKRRPDDGEVQRESAG